jgi:hypothetical protein
VTLKEICTLLNCKDSEHLFLAPLFSLGLYLEVKTKNSNILKTKKLELNEVTIVI